MAVELDPKRTAPCPECRTVLTRETRGACASCGVLLIPTGGMPGEKPARKTYKQDEDGSWRLVFDPIKDPWPGGSRT